MPQTSGLTVRQHVRLDVELDVDFVICEEHQDQVRFGTASGAAQPHATRGTTTDMSAGGMGIFCPQFVPRMCEGSVRVFGPAAPSAPDGPGGRDVIFEHRVKVQRVWMESHDPTYALGFSFVDPDPDIEQRIREILVHISTDTQETGPSDA
jgi:c-di-GMP-binding flagellar brake protein YcgR